MLKLAFSKDIFQQNFKVQKNIFMKYVIVIPKIIRFYTLSFFLTDVYWLQYKHW